MLAAPRIVVQDPELMLSGSGAQQRGPGYPQSADGACGHARHRDPLRLPRAASGQHGMSGATDQEAHEAAVAAVQTVLPLSWTEASVEAVNAIGLCSVTGTQQASLCATSLRRQPGRLAME